MPQFGAHAGHIDQIQQGTGEKHENDTEKVIFGLKIIPFFIPSDYMASSILRQKHSPELNIYITSKNAKYKKTGGKPKERFISRTKERSRMH